MDKLFYGIVTVATVLIGLKTYKHASAIKTWWHQKENQATIHDGYIKIDYYYLNALYSVRLPYHRECLADMAQRCVFAVNQNDTLIDITQQPGIPYSISPQNMGVDHFIIYDDTTELEYEIDKAPLLFH